MSLSVGTKAPDFTLLDSTLTPVTLSSFRGQRVLLAFFPAAFSGVCQTEMCTFQSSLQRLNNAGIKVLGISADVPWSNAGFSKANHLEFPLLSDWTLNTIKAYGVMFPNFGGIQGLNRSERAVFILDAEGVVEYVEVTENPGVEPDYDKIFAHIEG